MKNVLINGRYQNIIIILHILLSRSYHHVLAVMGMLTLYICYHKQNVSENIVGIVSVTVEEISSILNSISASKATCLNELHAIFIKDGSFVIAKSLTLQTYLQLLEISLMI